MTKRSHRNQPKTPIGRVIAPMNPFAASADLCHRLVCLRRSVIAALLAVGIAQAANAPAGHWVATWTASPMAADSALDEANSGFNGQTVRQIARISIGGQRIRVRLSNAYGTHPLMVGAAHLALHGVGPAIVGGSDRTLTFNGKGSVAIPVGALVLSDPVDLSVAPLSEIAVSLYFPVATGPVTWHELGMQTTFISPSGNATAAESLPIASTAKSLYVLSGVEVMAGPGVRAVVALGDSITDGYGSTADAHHRWPNFLAQRLNDSAGPGRMAVIDEGISGNRLLHETEGPNALARFDRDVLAQPGVTHLIVLEGINDIGMPGYMGRPEEEVTSEEIIGAYRQMILRAHEKGLKIYGATLTPFEGSGAPYYSDAGEAKREAVNAWIRSESEFDAVIDFDRVVRDPKYPTRLLPTYDSGDHLHPSDAGYQAMADSIDPNLLRP